jgi:hypothetical protein
VVWLVSHLKATCRRTLTSHNLRSGVCPGAAEEEVSDARATFSALERLGARKLYRLRYIPRWIPIGVCRGSPLWPLTWGNAESG